MPSKIENAMSKGMGTLKTAQATLRGLDGVFRTLAKQHGEVTALLKRAKATDDVGKRAELWEEIRAELLSHERAELLEVYPALEEHAETRSLARDHAEEAMALEHLIEQIDSLDEGEAEWQELLGELAEMVQRHAGEEETEIFPKAQATLGDVRTEELERPFLAAKERVMSELAAEM